MFHIQLKSFEYTNNLLKQLSKFTKQIFGTKRDVLQHSLKDSGLVYSKTVQMYCIMYNVYASQTFLQNFL